MTLLLFSFRHTFLLTVHTDFQVIQLLNAFVDVVFWSGV